MSKTRRFRSLSFTICTARPLGAEYRGGMLKWHILFLMQNIVNSIDVNEYHSLILYFPERRVLQR